jgi:murein DD-endopeptidase MepM/ murein hydrolase activator NlpD
MVEINHGGGMVTRYAHNAANLVAVGEQVKAGQAIAIVGSTGRTTGSHLHFEVRRDGKPVDPATIIGTTGKGSKISAII